VGDAVGEVGDELPVDLEQVEVQVLQVVEGREAGAEVVGGKLAAELGYAPGELPCAIDVDDSGGLGPLEAEAAAVGAVGLQLVGDVLRQPRGGYRLGGQVHAQDHLAAGVLLLGEDLDRARDDPAVDLL